VPRRQAVPPAIDRPDVGHVRRVGGELPAVRNSVAGARRRIGAVIGEYSESEQAILFRYFGEAATAYQASTEELIGRRASMSQNR
jgi:hypothetical protein